MAKNITTPGIYYITNLLTGRRYVGSSINVEKRLACHARKLKDNKHQNKELQADFNKLGEGGFSFDIIEVVLNENLLFNRENQHIVTQNQRQKVYNEGVICVPISLEPCEVLRFLKGLIFLENGCWTWRSARFVSDDGQHLIPARVSYWVFVGPYDISQNISRNCGNTNCCNPAHCKPSSLSSTISKFKQSKVWR